MEEKKKDKKIIVWILLIIFVIIFLFWYKSMTKTKSNSLNNNNSLVNCTKNVKDQPTIPNSWTSRLYSAPIKDNSGDRGTNDSQLREFSLAKMISKTGESIYFRLERTGFEQKDYVTGAKAVLEICNDQNMTPELYSSTNKGIQASGEKISARVLHLHNNPKVLIPGKYRIDALINIGGDWILSNRIENVTIRE